VGGVGLRPELVAEKADHTNHRLREFAQPIQEGVVVTRFQNVKLFRTYRDAEVDTQVRNVRLQSLGVARAQDHRSPGAAILPRDRPADVGRSTQD
jgi:hypothetical protein